MTLAGMSRYHEPDYNSDYGQSHEGKNSRCRQSRLLKHSLGNFVDDPPSVAQGGRGVVVSGCPACRRPFGTVNQLMHHLADDVLPVILRAAFKLAGEPTNADS